MSEAAASRSAVDPTVAVEGAARTAYGRLIAYLSARCRDVAAAEDALGDALVAALKQWPQSGVPLKPEAWLLTVARRRLIDAARRARVAEAAAPILRDSLVEASRAAEERSSFPDERLALLFVCAHPALDPSVQTPLMLQTVMGLDAASIAPAFLLAPASMGQRLVRAKAKIRDGGVPFVVPEPRQLPGRLGAVLGAIYAAYGTAWEDLSGAEDGHGALAEDAVGLGRVLVELMPEEPEALGLLALMLYCTARRAARRTPAGDFVPLGAQDVRLWSRPGIDEAERLLERAFRPGRPPARFQIEAAIQSAHSQRAVSGRTDWEAVALLYEGLVRVSPTAGALVGRAAAQLHARGPNEAFQLLDALPHALLDGYQPYWALRGEVLHRLGRRQDAWDAIERAVTLSSDPAVVAFLRRIDVADRQ